MGVASFTHQPGEDVRERLAVVVARAYARVAQRDGQREAAWGETTAGSAHDFYALASRGLPRGTWDEQAERWTEGNRAVTAERFAELRVQWALRLAQLTEGAHCCDARLKGQRVDFLHLRQIVTAEVASRLDDGQTTAGVQLWLDGFTFTWDTWRNSLNMLQWWTDERLQSLPGTDLDVLGGGLLRLERRVELMPDPEGHIADCLAQLLDGVWARRGYPVQQRFAAWRQGFDADRWHQKAIDELVQIAAVLTPPAADFALRQEQWRAWRRAPRQRSTPWSEQIDQGLQQRERMQCCELTSLRLLRLCVAFHRRAPLPSLADPFGAGFLEAHIDGDTAAFRSSDSVHGRERFAKRR